VVPVKGLPQAKTRLSTFAAPVRADLALAFAQDVLTAALDCTGIHRVIVVSDDEGTGARLARPGVEVARHVPTGLNPALAYGADLLRTDDPGLGVAALAADLPALRARDLAAALAGVRGRAFVADAQGVGTTLLAAAPGTDLLPGYGPGSRARHLASGAGELDGAPSLRQDVDTPADLQAALLLGVGPRTAAVALALTHAGGTARTELVATVAVHGHDGGSVLLDDGSRLAYPGNAVQPEVRLLHPGQRVRLVVDGQPPRVLAVTLVGLALPWP